ncbi:MAG: nucleoside phosphorylase [Patescibacteria group bacterium]
MPVPLIGKRKYENNPEVVRPQVFHEHMRSLGKGADIDGAKCAVIYFDGSLHEHIMRCYSVQNTGFRSLSMVNINDRKIVLCKSPIGAPAAVVNLEELIALGVCNFISVGTAGFLQKKILPASIVLCIGAFRDEGTSWHYLPDTKARVCKGVIHASAPMLNRIRSKLKKCELPFVTGLSWTTDAPYRENAKDIAFYRRKKAVTVEMEASALIAVSRYRGVNLASAFVASDLLAETNWQPLFHHDDLQPNLWKLFQISLEVLSAS